MSLSGIIAIVMVGSWCCDHCNYDDRITRSLKMHIYNLRWLAKLNFKVIKIFLFVTIPIAILTIIMNQKEEVEYEFRELRQFGKFLTQVAPIQSLVLANFTKMTKNITLNLV